MLRSLVASLSLALPSLVLLSGTSSAEQIVFGFAGDDAVTGSLIGPVDGLFVVETTSPDSNPDPSFGSYAAGPAVLHWGFSASPFTAASLDGNVIYTSLTGDPAVFSYSVEMPGIPAAIALFDEATAVGDDSLPLTPPVFDTSFLQMPNVLLGNLDDAIASVFIQPYTPHFDAVIDETDPSDPSVPPADGECPTGQPCKMSSSFEIPEGFPIPVPAYTVFTTPAQSNVASGLFIDNESLVGNISLVRTVDLGTGTGCVAPLSSASQLVDGALPESAGEGPDVLGDPLFLANPHVWPTELEAHPGFTDFVDTPGTEIWARYVGFSQTDGEPINVLVFATADAFHHVVILGVPGTPRTVRFCAPFEVDVTYLGSTVEFDELSGATTTLRTCGDVGSGVLEGAIVGPPNSPVMAAPVTCSEARPTDVSLSPLLSLNEPGQDHTVTAEVTDAFGGPVPGVEVSFEVISGPNAGSDGVCTDDADCNTDEEGAVFFTYTGDGGAGTDEILASFVDPDGVTVESNTVLKFWDLDCNQNDVPDGCDISCDGACAEYAACGDIPDENSDGIPDDCNTPPNCAGAGAEPDMVWPHTGLFQEIAIAGVTDADGEPVSTVVTGIFQDEPVYGVGAGNSSPDARDVGTETAEVRAERLGSGDGRVYHIDFEASDGLGGTCVGSVTVCVPLSPRPADNCVDQGPLFDSTDESPVGPRCGLGWELALVVPTLLSLRRRRLAASWPS